MGAAGPGALLEPGRAGPGPLRRRLVPVYGVEGAT